MTFKKLTFQQQLEAAQEIGDFVRLAAETGEGGRPDSFTERELALVGAALPFLRCTPDVQALSRALPRPEARNLLVQSYAEAGRINSLPEVEPLPDEVTNSAHGSGEAMLALRTVVGPFLQKTGKGDSYGLLMAASRLAFQLHFSEAIQQKITDIIMVDPLAEFPTAHAICVYAYKLPPNVRNMVLAVWAHDKAESPEGLEIGEGLFLLANVANPASNRGHATRYAIVTYMRRCLNSRPLTYEEAEALAPHIVGPVKERGCGEHEDLFNRQAIAALDKVRLVVVVAGSMATSAAHRLLREFIRCHGLPNEEAAIVLFSCIRGDDFGGADLRSDLAAACRDKGYEFDPSRSRLVEWHYAAAANHLASEIPAMVEEIFQKLRSQKKAG